MTAHACRTTLGNYINDKRCAGRLLDAHTPSHDQAITSVSVSLIYLASFLGLKTVKLPIRSSSRCHLPSMSTTLRLNLHTVPLMLSVKQVSCEYQFLKSFGMTRQGNEPRSTDCKADTLTTTPSLLNQALQNPQATMHKYQSIKNYRPELWAPAPNFSR